MRPACTSTSRTYPSGPQPPDDRVVQAAPLWSARCTYVRGVTGSAMLGSRDRTPRSSFSRSLRIQSHRPMPFAGKSTKARYSRASILPIGGVVSFLGRVSVLSLTVTICVALLAALLPVAAVAAPEGKRSEYIVALSVADAGRVIKPSSRDAKQRIRQHAKAARETTDQVAKRNGVKARQVFDAAAVGFSARMTPAEAAQLASDPSVANVRVARRFKVAGQVTPAGIARVMATTGGAGPDVNAQVAVVDTGIGPATGDGTPIDSGSTELNIRGGVNCSDDPGATDERWGDTTAMARTWRGSSALATTASARSASHLGPTSGQCACSRGGGSEASVICGLDWAIATYANDTPGYRRRQHEHPGSDASTTRRTAAPSSLDPREPGDGIQQWCARAHPRRWASRRGASAGNGSINANESAPGGYDQVISVGGHDRHRRHRAAGRARRPVAATAISEGRHLRQRIATTAWTSTSWPPARAWPPPTTRHDMDDAPVAMTGTSMAAPHVTGAIARYVAAQGKPASAGVMRQLIRACRPHGLGRQERPGLVRCQRPRPAQPRARRRLPSPDPRPSRPSSITTASRWAASRRTAPRVSTSSAAAATAAPSTSGLSGLPAALGTGDLRQPQPDRVRAQRARHQPGP